MMSAQPVQVSIQPPSPTLELAAKMMHNLPPVFSPDNSPPLTGSTSRKHYLPLISPVLTEDSDRPFDFSRRRGSTPSLQKSSASQYFEDLRKRRRGSEISTQAAESTSTEKETSVNMEQKAGEMRSARFAELPTALAQTIIRALGDQARATLLKKRTMSLPSSAPAFGLAHGLKEEEEERQRRASMRSKQLALLASQARLARTGASSVQTALVAERAVKGAIQEVVEDLQASKISKKTAIKVEESEESEGNGSSSSSGESKQITPTSDKSERSDSSEKTPEDGDQVPNAVVAPGGMWSQALASPQAATAFLASASEVAHDWANGFYKFEGEWAEDALRKEQLKLSETQSTRKRQREGEDVDDTPLSTPRAQAIRLQPPEITLNSKSATPESREASPANAPSEMIPLTNKVTIAVPPSLPSSSARSSLMAAQKRLSMSMPVVPISKPVTSAQEGGQMVDVLSNFVDLIEQRKETCHGLEKLAQDARRLSTVQLPSIASAMATKQKIDEELVVSETEGESSDATMIS